MPRAVDRAAEVASCPDCGVLIWVNVTTKTGKVGVFDFYEDAQPLVARTIGAEPVIRQGFGVGNGHAHYCPPTINHISIEDDPCPASGSGSATATTD